MVADDFFIAAETANIRPPSTPPTRWLTPGRRSQVADVGSALDNTPPRRCARVQARLYLKIPKLMSYSWGIDAWYKPNMDGRFNLERSRSSRRASSRGPCLHNIYTEGYTIKALADFSQGKCKKAFDARVHVYVVGKACIGYIFGRWCYASVHKNDVASLSFSPVVMLDINMKPQATEESVSTKLAGFNLLATKDRRLSAKINLTPAAAIIGAPLIPSSVGGAIGNLLANRYFKDRIRQFKGHIERRLGMATGGQEGDRGGAAPPCPARGGRQPAVALRKLLNQLLPTSSSRWRP